MAKKLPVKDPVEEDAPAQDESADEGGEVRETAEDKLAELIERGKKAGKLITKDLEGIEQWGLDPEAVDKFYEEH